jgi:hypothetical protein
MRSTTWIAVLPTSPVLLEDLTILLLLMGFIVAIPTAIAYYETGFYRFPGKNWFKSNVLEP